MYSPEEALPFEQTPGRDISPADSGVELTSQPQPVYSGKGKGRVTEDDALTEQDYCRLYEKLRERLRKKQEEDDRRKAELVQKEQEEAEARLAVAKKARLRECTVCGDAKDPLDFPAQAPTPRCKHTPQTCTECMQSWMASEFDSKGTDGILCPECPTTLEYADVQRAASAKTFEAYDRVSTNNALSSYPDFAWCLSADCQSGQLNINNRNYMDCANCGYKQCLKHKIPWHVGETCDEYDYRTSGRKRSDEEKATEAMLDNISKKCPGKGCNWRIQKVDGCDHMTCRKCKFEFCWQCLASQKEIKRVGNTAHQAWCKFHSQNLSVAWPFNVH